MYTGENIRAARIYRKLTQKELAEKCKLATGTIQQYELNKRKPKVEQIIKIANALDLGYLALDKGSAFYDYVAQNPTVDETDAKNFNKKQSELLQKATGCDIEILEKSYIDIQKIQHDEFVKKARKKTLNKQMKKREQKSVHLDVDITECEENILKYMELLNGNGQLAAVNQIKLLTKIPEYQKDHDTET